VVVKAGFSRDGKRVAALSSDWWAGVWSRDTGRLLRLCSVPRGQFADNADLVLSPDGRRLAVSAGNTTTLWDLGSGETRRWTLPWGLTEALAFPDPNELFLFRKETRDGSRPPDSGAPSSEYPRVYTLRNLLGTKPIEPIKVISDLNGSVQDIEASPDGSCFVIAGLADPGTPRPHPFVRLYTSRGAFLTDLFSQRSNEAALPFAHFDPSGKLVVLGIEEGKEIVLEVPSGRFLRLIPDAVRGVGPGARRLAHLDREYRLQLYDHAGNRLLYQLDELAGPTTTPFSPDLDGRYLMWGNSSEILSIADLVEVQRRLAEVGLGW
jgi:WD40 repeat protein